MYMYSVTLSMESTTLHAKRELVSMENVDLCIKREIRYFKISFSKCLPM